MYDVDSLRAKFVITAQDSTVSSDKEVIYYSILSDSIGRRFLVAEVGCSDQQNKLLIQKGIKDTVSIKINRYTNRGQAQIRTTNEILFIIGKDGDSYEVYETAQLCKHKLIE